MRKSDESDESHNSYKYVKKSHMRKSDEKAEHESEANMQNKETEIECGRKKKVIYSIKNKMVSLYKNI